MNDTDLSSRQIQEAEGEVAFQETKPKVTQLSCVLYVCNSVTFDIVCTLGLSCD